MSDVENKAQTDESAERVTELERALEEALAERNRLWDELNRERANAQEHEARKREIEMIYASNMWKAAGRYQRVKKAVLDALGRSPER